MVKSSYEVLQENKRKVIYANQLANQLRIDSGYSPKNDVRRLNPISERVDSRLGQYYITASETTSVIQNNTSPAYAVTSIIAYNLTNGIAAITWTPLSQTAVQIQSYKVTSSPGGFNGTTLGNYATVSGLTAGTIYTFTVVGTTTQGAQYSLGTSYLINPRLSVLFNRVSQKLTAPANAGFSFAGADFTFEAWIYFTGTSDGDYDIMNIGRPADNSYNVTFSVYKSGAVQSMKFKFNENQAGQAVYTGGNGAAYAIPSNRWVHVCMMRSSGSIGVFMNGIRAITQVTISSTGVGSSAWTLNVGGNVINTNPFSGKITNARIVKGAAVYTYGTTSGTTYFTPPTEPLTAITGTQFLLQGLVDTSANYAALTNTDNVSIDTATPF